MKLQDIKNNKETNKEFSLVLELKEIYRTSDGLNIFTVGDEETTFKLTVFTAGKAAYEHVEKGDVKEFTFKTKIFQEKLQGDLINIIDVNSELIQKFKNKIDETNQSKYLPKNQELLIKTNIFEKMKPSMIAASSAIRRAVMEKRPIHITHHGDCDGYGAGLLLEQSITNLIKQYYPSEKFLRQYISRNFSKTPFYDLVDATKDIGFFISNTNRFGVVAPLILIVDNGSTEQDLLTIEKVKLYGADVIVIDHHDPGQLDENGKSLICKHTLAHVNPHLQGKPIGLSASMLSYQISHYINADLEPNVVSATAGGVADRCEGEEIDFLINKSGLDREYFKKLAVMVDYEIYMTKMNLSAGGIYTLLNGSSEKRDALISLYEPIINQARKEVENSLQKYSQEIQLGKHKVLLVDGEKLTLWGDYYTIGKLAGISFDLFKPSIVIVHTDAMMVFRAQKESNFDVNKLLFKLKKEISYARISGGGHAVAGSIKFLSVAKTEILDFIKKQIEQ